MRLRNVMHAFAIAPLAIAAAFPTAQADTPLSAAPPPAKMNPGYHHPDMDGTRTGPLHDAIVAGLQAGTLQTLPSWTQGFQVKNRDYSYTMLGTDPAAGPAKTVIETILVPIRLTIPTFLVHGEPLVLDATHSMRDVIDSPIFTKSKFASGKLQFADAMLHAEFPTASKAWHLTFHPSVASTINVSTGQQEVQVLQAKSGKYVAFVKNNSKLSTAINDIVRHAAANTYVVIITYNAMYEDAFGFHGAHLNKEANSLAVYTYTSWLVGVDDVFTLPSPNADTFAHEIAESTHDPFLVSRTKEWGDWFNDNRCFQNYIEVGDAVEDAPARVQNYHQKVVIDGQAKTYVLQTEAMLPWFERQYPSTALNGAYSFPGVYALLGPAPFDCVK